MLALSPFLLASSFISGSLAATFAVDVGLNGLAFTPPTVTAAQGDEVIFTFHPKNHTLTQSTLAAPCQPVAGGGNSGFMFVNTTTLPTKRIVVPDATTPLWFYCAQATHCQSGMVFSINPKSADQQAQFVATAKASAADGTPPAAGSTGTTTSDPAAASQTSTSTGSTGTGSTGTGSTGSTTGTGQIWDVAVGFNGTLTYTPDRLTNVQVGDMINFQFLAGSHTVTQAAFTSPCNPLTGGTDSGPMPATAAAPVNYTLPITDVTKPLWYYCKTGNHCRQGMVFSVNAPLTGNTADAWKADSIAGTSVSGSASQTGAGSQPTGAGNSAPALKTGFATVLVAGALAAFLL